MSISRRKFLSWMGMACFTATTVGKVEAVTNRHFEGYPNGFSVLHDSALCIGCRECEKACSRVNELSSSDNSFSDMSVLNKYRRTTSSAYTVINRYKSGEVEHYYKKQCNHCLEPACASACFVGAFQKTSEGAVIYDPSVCVGCRYCMVACPFEIPTYDYDDAFSPSVRKCTMCYPRVTKNQLPGCVESCPSGALIFGKRKEIIRIARNRIEKAEGVYVDHIYGEHEMGGTSWLYISGTSFDNIGLRTDLGTLAAGEFTSPALGAVPMVVGLWPILLTGIYAINRSNEILASNDKSNAIDKAVNKIKNLSEAKLSEVLKKAKIDKDNTVKLEVRKALEKVSKTKSSDIEK